MGRRKIEIQPITHERNRSVTFLKRKNGLFKKAYELGVLCSVDVAVIIFEERPGHHVKLYQYCSTDVHSMVQRHIRFDGEKDTRTPLDFNNAKTGETADDDDDGEDDDGTRQSKQQLPASKQNKVKSEGSSGATATVPIRPLVATNTDSAMTIDLDYRNARTSPINGSSSSSIPVSGERHSTATPAGMRGVPINSAKRPRLFNAGGAPELQSMSSVHPAMGVNAVTGYPYRLEVDVNQYTSPSMPTLGTMPHSHATPHSSMAALYPSSSAVPGLLGSQNTHPNFLQHSPPNTLRTVTFLPHSSSPYQPQQQNIYHRQPHQQQPSQHSHPNHMPADLLNTQSQDQFPSFDWPVHQQQQQQQRDATHAGPSNADSNWFDFLSQQSATIPHPMTIQQAHQSRPPSSSIPGQRPMAFSHPPSSSDGTSSHTRPQSGHKRGREDEGASAGSSERIEEDERIRRPGTGMGNLPHPASGGAPLEQIQSAGARPRSVGERPAG